MAGSKESSLPSTTLSSFAFRAIGFAQFGGVGDGIFDNSPALNSFGMYARAESRAGRGVELHVSPGVYNFNSNTYLGTLFDIKRLRIVGYGAIFQNTYQLATPFFPDCFPSIRNGDGPLINSTAVGDKFVTLKSPALHFRFSVGDWVLVSSLDLQYYGYPPNLDRFDFVQITAKKPSVGILEFDRPLGNAHRDDFPDGGNANAGGKARIWPLGSVGSEGGTWDIEHVYEGIQINLAGGSATTYMPMSGRKLRYVNCILPGISPSICQSLEIIGGIINSENEPDKLVGSVLIDGTEIRQGISFQSSSIDRVTLRNGTGGILSGMTKNTIVQNWDAPYFAENVAGQNYGAARNVTVEASILRSMPYYSVFQPTNGANRVDGRNVSFSDGIFAILKSVIAGGTWGVVPGEVINLSGPNGIYSGNLGNGIVTRIYEDSERVYFETTLPYTSMPPWANGEVRLQRNANSTYINCQGCDVALALSEASRKGKRGWEFFSRLFAGRTPTAGMFLSDAVGGLNGGPIGDLTRAKVNVIQGSSAANGLLKISCSSPGAYIASTMASAAAVTIAIDLMVTGIRDFTQTGLTGKKARDSVILDGDEQSTLPTGRWYPGLMWSYSGLTPINFEPRQLPIIEFELECDTGFARRSIASAL